MKKNIRVSIIVLLSCGFAGAMGVEVYANLVKGRYQPATLGQSEQGAPQEGIANSEYGGSAYPLYPPELEAGEGKAETEGYCSMCHSTRYITMQPALPPATWEAEVNKMKKAFGATIPDQATVKIIHYLEEHYATGTRKR
ncbi:MAG: sulfide dehydrogenase [Candidatus Acidiferrum sp.]